VNRRWKWNGSRPNFALLKYDVTDSGVVAPQYAKEMSTLPISVGDPEAQDRFIKQNSLFLQEYPELNELSKRIFLRALKPPNQQEVERLRELPADDPAVLAFENKVTADRIDFLPRPDVCR
jgi:hypothetical protein